jgi:polyhydroxyalkanoate synthesis regulator phasin
MAAKKISKKTKALPMLKESAHEIWLAGLGAFALAGEEGGKLFGQLGDLQGDARTAVARLTTPIEAGMTSAMHRLGVPTRKEIATLTKRVEELTRVVAKSKNGARKSTRRAPRAAPVNA